VTRPCAADDFPMIRARMEELRGERDGLSLVSKLNVTSVGFQCSIRIIPEAGPEVRRLPAGGGSLQRTRLWSPIPWLLGKNTGNLSRIATGTLLILRDIKDLPIEFPSS
jgi:hypothetical protein